MTDPPPCAVNMPCAVNILPGGRVALGTRGTQRACPVEGPVAALDSGHESGATGPLAAVPHAQPCRLKQCLPKPSLRCAQCPAVFLRGLRILLLCTGLEYADAWARWCCRSRRTRAVRGFGLDSQPHIATQSFRPIFSSIFSSGQMRRHNEHDLEAVLRLHSTEDGRIA